MSQTIAAEQENLGMLADKYFAGNYQFLEDRMRQAPDSEVLICAARHCREVVTTTAIFNVRGTVFRESVCEECAKKYNAKLLSEGFPWKNN